MARSAFRSDVWLQVRVDGKEGWLHYEEDFMRLGMIFGIALLVKLHPCFRTRPYCRATEIGPLSRRPQSGTSRPASQLTEHDAIWRIETLIVPGWDNQHAAGI